VPELVTRRVSARLSIATLVTVTLGAILGATYIRVYERHSRIWNAAYALSANALHTIRTDFPRLAPGSVLFTSDYPNNETLGVPIFTVNYDLYGAVMQTYKTSDVAAYPLITGLQLTCEPHGVIQKGPRGSPLIGYGAAWFVNLATGQHVRPLTQSACQAVVGQYVPGPLYLTTGY
jgi:hypothetical protein